MNVGDKVKHQSGNFNFTGKVIALATGSNGQRSVVVQQEDTGYMQLFGEHSLNVLEEARPLVRKLVVKHFTDEPEYHTNEDWYQDLPATNAHQRSLMARPQLPLKLWVPVKPKSHQAAAIGAFKAEVRLNYLPTRPVTYLITDNIKVDMEFHFNGLAIGDLDNLVKPTIDLLKGAVIYDDAQVKELTARLVPHSPKLGFQVVLTKYVPKG